MSDAASRVDPGLCRRLRWKGQFIDAEPDPTVPPATEAGAWCGKTAGPLGPDGRPVDRAVCRPGRGCFEAP